MQGQHAPESDEARAVEEDPLARDRPDPLEDESRDPHVADQDRGEEGARARQPPPPEPEGQRNDQDRRGEDEGLDDPLRLRPVSYP